MTKDEIHGLIRAIPDDLRDVSDCPLPEGLVWFAHRIAELQREKDAKVCKKISAESGGYKYDMFGKDLAIQCSAAIRNQGETK